MILSHVSKIYDNLILFYIWPSRCMVGRNTIDMPQIQVIKQMVYGRDDVIGGTVRRNPLMAIDGVC